MVGSLTRAVVWFVQIVRHPAAKDGVEAIPSVYGFYLGASLFL